MSQMSMIYSREREVESCEDPDDLVDHATVIVAVLREGVTTPPVSLDEIERIWCPTCRWLNPDEAHAAECEDVGMSFTGF